MVVSVFKNHYLILQFFNENDEDIILNNSDGVFLSHIKNYLFRQYFLLLIETLNTFCFEFFDVGKPMSYPIFNDKLQFTSSKKPKNKKQKDTDFKSYISFYMRTR